MALCVTSYHILHYENDTMETVQCTAYRTFLERSETNARCALGDIEIDFVATIISDVLYVQVAYVIPDETTMQREFGNLLKIPDNHPKLVVSMDEIPFENNKGIRHLHIRDFLTKDW